MPSPVAATEPPPAELSVHAFRVSPEDRLRLAQLAANYRANTSVVLRMCIKLQWDVLFGGKKKPPTVKKRAKPKARAKKVRQ